MTALKIIATNRKGEFVTDAGLYASHESAEAAKDEIAKSLRTMLKFGILNNYEIRLYEVKNISEFERIQGRR